MALIPSILNFKKGLLSASLLCFPLLLCVPSHAQSEDGPAPRNLVAPRDNISGARFFWCAGAVEKGDLDAYVAAGFDTLVIPVPWRAGEGGAIFEANYSPQRTLASEAALRGLKIVFSLPASPEGLSVTRVSADSPSYNALWTNWAQNAIESLSSTPGLSGWMLPDDSLSLATFDDAGFRHYLGTQFASIEALNTQWETTYTDFDSIFISDVEAMVAAWKSRVQSNGKESGVLSSVGALNQTPDPHAAFSPAGLALAAYKAEAWKDLMSLWASTLRGADTRHAIFSGVCPDYAQLLAMPEGVDISVTGVAPSIAEPDIVTHNPQGVDIARRGGTRSAVAVLSIQPQAALNVSSIAQLLPRWVEAALAHGARGVAFDSFDSLQRNPVLSEAISKTLTRIKAAPLDPQSPLATTAVLLQPLAEGATLQLGQNAQPRGLYGFGAGLVEGEPSNLVASLRWGTAFGSVDYLTPEDLSAVDLSHYSTILAPQLLDCSPETGQRLADWMGSGGTLVADLGLGALQNGGSATALPPQMAQLAGGIGPFELRQAGFNLRGATPHPLLPTWAKMLDERPGMPLSRGEGGADTAFEGAVGFAPSTDKAVQVAVGPSVKLASMLGAYGATPGANGAGGTDIGKVALTVASVRRGYFVFAPFRLWASWRPGQLGFDPLHGDILARGADIAIATDALTPFPAGTKLGTTRFPEVINRVSNITILNHDAGGGGKNVAVDTTGSGDWLWSNAFVRTLPASAAVLGAARPAPIPNPDEIEARASSLSLYAVAYPGQKLVCRMRPIAVQNLGGGTTTGQILKEEPNSLAVNVWGPTLQVAAPITGVGWQPIAPDGTSNFRLTIVDSNDGYRCPAGSRHRISIEDFGTPDETEAARKKIGPSVQTVVADARGRLKLEFTGAACSVKIEPDTGKPGKSKR